MELHWQMGQNFWKPSLTVWKNYIFFNFSPTKFLKSCYKKLKFLTCGPLNFLKNHPLLNKNICIFFTNLFTLVWKFSVLIPASVWSSPYSMNSWFLVNPNSQCSVDSTKNFASPTWTDKLSEIFQWEKEKRSALKRWGMMKSNPLNINGPKPSWAHLRLS